MRKITIKLHNEFHNTKTTARVEVLENGYGWLTKRQLKRIEKALCGVDGCQCGYICGMLGYGNPDITPTTTGAWVDLNEENWGHSWEF